MSRLKICFALLVAALVLPTTANADTRQQLQTLAGVVDRLGMPMEAARMRGIVDAIPDEELDAVYGGADLDPVIHGLEGLVPELDASRLRVVEDAAEFSRARAVARERAALAVEAGEGLERAASGPLGAFPDADYAAVTVPELCPLHTNVTGRPVRRNDPMNTITTLDDLRKARIGIEQVQVVLNLVQGLWAAINRACELEIHFFATGGNFSFACIPVDIVLAVAEFALAEAQYVVQHFQSSADRKLACDAAINTGEIDGTYRRLEHIHDDVDQFKADVLAQLAMMEAQIDLVLRIQLEDDLALGSGGRLGVAYTDRLDDACNAAQAAITEAAGLGYLLNPRAQMLHDEGVALKATDPKAAFDSCKQAYRLATNKSTKRQ